MNFENPLTPKLQEVISPMTYVSRRHALKLLVGTALLGYEISKPSRQILAQSLDIIAKPPTLEVSRAEHITQELGKGIGYYVIPHPDDEMSAWSLIQKTKFPFFILMTKGENSSHCISHGGKGSVICKNDRIASYNNFLNNFYSVEKDERSNDQFELYIGSDSARIIYDCGDQKLTPQNVAVAITHARNIGSEIAPEKYLVSAGVQYGHPDHKVVYEAVKHNDFSSRLAVNGSLYPDTNFSVPVDANYLSIFGCPNGPASRAYEWLLNRCGVEKTSLQNQNESYIEF
ncbi:MAG: hypothetical protein NVSMB46_09430 [Candidatus Saccharimonadales bacterium]